MSAIETIAGAVVGGTRALIKRLPKKVKKKIEDRVFYAIYQMTRVTNDAYGWRPPAEGPKDEK